jgi:signal transduction histidine kinase
VLWVEANDVIVRDGEGNAIGMRGVTMDVSERKKLEDEVRERTESQRAMLETMIEGMPIGLALLDKNACIISMNAEWMRMTNVDASAHGKQLYGISPAFAQRRAYYEQVLAGEPVDLSDVPYSLPGDSRTLYRDIHLRPVRDATGAVAGMLNAVIDVTERYELDEQKEALLALTSHELKTPITTIKGYSQLALRAANQTGDEKLSRTLRTIDEQANRLTRLINELMEVSRIGSDTLPLHYEQFDMCDLVRQTVDNLAPTAPDFRIELDVEPSTCPVFADRGRIEQVIVNLMQNAIKYSGDSRSIEVGVKRIEEDGGPIPLRRHRASAISTQGRLTTDGEGGDGGGGHDPRKVEVSVRDYGVGIPTDQQEQVFMRFFRARNVATKGTSGLGLGLYIAHEIAVRHGGEIRLESEEGRGSTFYFTLPLAEGG